MTSQQRTYLGSYFLDNFYEHAKFGSVAPQTNKDRGIEWSYNFSTARKILPLLDLLAKFRRVLACSCSQNFAIARMLGFSLTLVGFLKFRKTRKTDHVRTEDTSIVNSSDLQFYRRGEGIQHQGNLSNYLGFGT